MYQEFNQHKKSDAVKWIIAFTLIIVLMAGVVAALILSLDKPTPIKPQENGTQQESSDESNAAVVLTLGQPRLMSVKSPALAADNTQQYVSQTVTATITPSTVVDKYVTWSVAWANDAPLKDKNISDYIKVTDDSQGNLTATVNCYKSFKGSKAILTCTTRQGGKTGTVNIVYEGVPSSMSIIAPTGVTKYNLGKDSVDLLYVGKSYSLNLAMDNIFHSVGSNFNDFTVTVTGVGSVTCGSYSQSGRGAGWSSHSNIVDFNKIAKEFVTCSTSGNTLSINVTRSLYDYYESKETKDHYPLLGSNSTGKTSIEPTFIVSMQYVAQRAKATNREMWTYLQSIGYGGANRIPTSAADISFQAYTFLAYGGKQISWFCYWSPIRYDGLTHFTEAMIELDGTKTAVYDYVKEINREILAFDDIYDNFEWQGSMTKVGRENAMGENDNFEYVAKYVMTSHPRIEKYTAEQDTLIGVFKDKAGKEDGFMVVNFTDPAKNLSNKIEITFKDTNYAAVVVDGELTTIKLNNGVLKLNLDSGDGAFVIPLK